MTLIEFLSDPIENMTPAERRLVLGLVYFSHQIDAYKAKQAEIDDLARWRVQTRETLS